MTRAHASGDPFEALGDQHRRDILRLLSDGDKPVLEIAAALPISRPAVSRHLRLLKEAGLVAEQGRAPAGSITYGTRGCRRSRPTSSRSGATPPAASG